MKVEWTVYEKARLETVREYLLSFTVISLCSIKIMTFCILSLKGT